MTWDFLTDRGLLWFFVGILFLGIDFALPHLVLLFFGIGALAAACISYLGFDLSIELLGFTVFSVLSLILFRRKLSSVFGGGAVKKVGSDVAHPLLGHVGVVSRDIGQGVSGEVAIDGSFWRAEADCSVRTGTRVTVLGVSKNDALVLVVGPSKD